MEPMWIMFYHDFQGQVSYFSVEDDLESASNDFFERLIDQLSRHDEEEIEAKENPREAVKDEQGEDMRIEKAEEKMIQLIKCY